MCKIDGNLLFICAGHAKQDTVSMIGVKSVEKIWKVISLNVIYCVGDYGVYRDLNILC